MVSIVIGCVFLVLSLGFAYAYVRVNADARIYADVPANTIAELEALARSSRSPLDCYAELRGVVECDEPLQSELAEVPCVFFEASVERLYEERFQAEDEAGNPVWEMDTATQVLSHNRRSTPFILRDRTGSIAIDPKGATVIAETVFSRLDPPISVKAKSLNLGSVGSHDTYVPASDDPNAGELGHQLEESVIPLGRHLYVQGKVRGEAGNLRVENPQDHRRFLLSVRSDTRLDLTVERSAKGYLYAAIACGVLGVLWFGIATFLSSPVSR